MRPRIDGQGEAGVRDERLLPDGEPFPWVPLAMLAALAIVMSTIGLDSGLWDDAVGCRPVDLGAVRQADWLAITP